MVYRVLRLEELAGCLRRLFFFLEGTWFGDWPCACDRVVIEREHGLDLVVDALALAGGKEIVLARPRFEMQGELSLLDELFEVLALSAFDAASMPIGLGACAPSEAAEHLLRARRLPLGLQVCCVAALPLVACVALRHPLGKRRAAVPAVVIIDLFLTDVLNELVLLVLLSLVVLVELQAALLGYGRHPLRKEAAGEDRENAKDEEGGSPRISSSGLGLQLVVVRARYEDLLVVLVGADVELFRWFLRLDDLKLREVLGVTLDDDVVTDLQLNLLSRCVGALVSCFGG